MPFIRESDVNLSVNYFFSELTKHWTYWFRIQFSFQFSSVYDCLLRL